MSTFAQSDYVKRSTLGVHFFFNDFQTPAYIKSTSLGQTLRDKKWAKIRDMNAGLAVNYLKGLNRTFDVSTTLGGSFLSYPIENKPKFSDKLLLEWDAMIHAKMLSDRYWVSPYLSAGVGFSAYGGYFGAFLPVGMGLQVSLYEEAFLFVNSQYRIRITDNTTDHFYYSFGVAGNIGPDRKPKVIPPPPPPPLPVVVDTDGDGIEDSKDACPTQAGPVSLNGCPDRDKDGIADKDDKCPDQPGLARYAGCPIPDTDGDGINDEEDKCKDVAGLARYSGCPIPDTDGDGINDEEDQCPTERGIIELKGCPKPNFAAEKVQFQTGSAILTKAAKLELDKGAAFMNQYPTLKFTIAGHTDNTGKEAANQILSEKRAAAVETYLVSKGAHPDRINTVGYGQSKPIADNKTAAGRAKNRRVEFTMQ
jgi:outer membrane protein OmpA-like peptidoglycan-associated protein